MSRAHPLRVLVAGLSIIALSTVTAPAPAHARRASAASGYHVFSSTGTCFNWDYQNGQTGIRLLGGANCTGGFIPFAYVVPVHLDTGGSKTVSITVRQTAANTLSCGLFENDLSGNLVETVVYDPFPVQAGYVTRSETITVGNSNNLVVFCSFNQSAAGVDGARLLSISY